jgi:DNA-binding FadR family transcriptional regulator
MYKKLINKPRLSFEVASQIKQLIQSEKLKPGDKLPNEIQLTELFGVSRPTVREAVKSLASHNIIEIIRGKGTFITKNPGLSSDPLGLDFVTDKNLPMALLEARLVIEPSVARLAAEKANNKDIEKLQAYIDEMAHIENQSTGWVSLEFGFHRGIACATQNPVIMRIVPVIHDAIVKSLKYAPRSREDHHTASLEHIKILSRIKEKDPKKAFDAMYEHIQNSMLRTVRYASGKHSKPKAH